MKLSVSSFLTALKMNPSKNADGGSTKSTTNKKKKKEAGQRSIERSDASFASTATTSSEESATLQSTPKSVLPPVSVHDLFSVFDRDGDGKITLHELELVLRRLGPEPPTAEELATMVADADRDGDGCISLEEFEAVAAAAAAVDEGDEDERQLQAAFAVFDADGDGRISAEELLGVFAALGDESCTLDECRRMIGGVDSDGDGFVCFGDFARMMDARR